MIILSFLVIIFTKYTKSGNRLWLTDKYLYSILKIRTIKFQPDINNNNNIIINLALGN